MVVALRVFGRLMFWLSMVLMLALALAWAWDRSDTNAAAAATPAAAEDVPVTYTEAQAIEGAEVFLTNCARCHGIDLKGDFGPPLKGKKKDGPPSKKF
mgnify:CR=1 FL=1